MTTERSPAPGPDPSHHDLIGLARSLRDAVLSDDRDRVHAQLARLRSALAQHLETERARPPAPSGPLTDLVADGQARLLALVDEVMLDLEDEEGGCTCIVRSAQIERALRRQAAIESRAGLMSGGATAPSDRALPHLDGV